MNTKDLLVIVTVKTIKLEKNVGKKITTLLGISETLSIQKAGQLLGKSKEAYVHLLNPNHINKTCCMFPEIWLPNLWQF